MGPIRERLAPEETGMRPVGKRSVVVLLLAVAALGAAGATLAPRNEKAPEQRIGKEDLKARLQRLPNDWTAWVELGLTHLERARATGDPSTYPSAQQAFERSLSIRQNAPALAGLGALAAAKHDFAAALRYGQSAVEVDPYLATARGVVADALVELGRYDEAWEAIQQQIDLRPDTGSYARASYSHELRGDVPNATALMQKALDVAPGPADVAFTRYHLAMLAFDSGDLAAATEHADAGLRVAPDDPPLAVARARIAAARGDTAAAVTGLRAVVARLPLPAYAAELGDLLESTGDKTGAKQQYDLVETAATVQKAQGVDVDSELALFHADHKNPAALNEARAAYAKRPSITTADALAWALHASGRDAEALTHANEALRLGTRNAMSYYHRGMILAALGQTAKAKADLAEALRINPYFSVRHAPIARATLGGMK